MALGHELEHYNQLYDAIQFHICKAISVLDHNIVVEQRRVREATSKAEEATKLPDPQMDIDEPTPLSKSTEPGPALNDAEQGQSIATPSANLSILARRPSAISMTSLHRPTFPLKLDLSSAQLRLSADETPIFTSGLASPVTLAPKSARPMDPNEIPPELMAVFGPSNADDSVDIDLTVPPDVPLDQSLGSSAEKPIELDIDGMDIDMTTMSELFGDDVRSDTGSNPADVEDLFTEMNDSKPPATSMSDPKPEPASPSTEKDSLSLFDSMQPGPDNAATPNTIIASLDQSSTGEHPNNAQQEDFDLSAIDLTNLDDNFFEGEDAHDPELMMDVEQLLNMGTESVVMDRDAKSGEGRKL
jgi:hypothetical protein